MFSIIEILHVVHHLIGRMFVVVIVGLHEGNLLRAVACQSEADEEGWRKVKHNKMGVNRCKKGGKFKKRKMEEFASFMQMRAKLFSLPAAREAQGSSALG